MLFRSLAIVLEQMGRYEEAITLFQGSSSSPGYAYARAGRKAEALKALEELKALFARKRVGAAHIATIYAGLGELRMALDWLEKGYTERDQLMILLKVNPRFDPLRSEPRFADLLRRIGFTP